MIHISSKIHGHEVAGVRHPQSAVHYEDDQFTQEQIQAFLEDEFLSVEFDTPQAFDSIQPAESKRARKG